MCANLINAIMPECAQFNALQLIENAITIHFMQADIFLNYKL